MVGAITRFFAANARDLIGLGGVGLLTVGAAHIYPPAGYLVPGAICLSAAILWRHR